MNGLSKLKTNLLLAYLIIAWGLSWPVTKMALADSPPLLFAGLRIFLGGTIFLLFALKNKHPLHVRKTWPIYIVSMLLNVAGFYSLQTIGLNYLPSGIFSALIYFQPVFLAVLSWLLLGEDMYLSKWLGVISGFAGVIFISVNTAVDHLSLTGVLLAAGAAVCWALGTIFVKKAGNHVDSIWLTTIQLIVGGLLLLFLGLTIEGWHLIHWTKTFTAILFINAIFFTALGWHVYFILIKNGEVTKVGANTFLIPLVSIVSSKFLLQEKFTLQMFIGIFFIIAGIFLVNYLPASKSYSKKYKNLHVS